MPLFSNGSDRLCYIHMPKCGGTYVKAALPSWSHIGGHAPALPTDPSSSYSFFGSIRPPCDWYESLYLHCMRDNPKYQSLNSFAKVLKFWLKPTHMPAALWPPLPMFARMGDPPDKPLWSASVHFWFGGGLKVRWLCPMVIDIRHLREGLMEITDDWELMYGHINMRSPEQAENELFWPCGSAASVDQADGEIMTGLFTGKAVLSLKGH